MNYANLMVTRDSSDEVTLYALSDEVYNKLEAIIETMKDQRDPDLDDKLEKIFKIVSATGCGYQSYPLALFSK